MLNFLTPEWELHKNMNAASLLIIFTWSALTTSELGRVYAQFEAGTTVYFNKCTLTSFSDTHHNACSVQPPIHPQNVPNNSSTATLPSYNTELKKTVHNVLSLSSSVVLRRKLLMKLEPSNANKQWISENKGIQSSKS